MANRSIAVHTTEQNIERLDEEARNIRRSRNSLINEAIEMLLERFDADRLHAAKRYVKANGRKRTTTPTKKAGAR